MISHLWQRCCRPVIVLMLAGSLGSAGLGCWGAGASCGSDADCPDGRRCVPGGGVLVRGGHCIPKTFNDGGQVGDGGAADSNDGGAQDSGNAPVDASHDSRRVDTADSGTAPDTSPSDPDTTEEPDTSDATETDGGGKCFNCVDEKFKVDRNVGCSSDADERPTRCDQTPDDFANWGPASVVTRFEVASEKAQSCCFNIDGSSDGSNDNGFATLVSFLPGTSLDRRIKMELVDGNFVLLHEFQGLTDLDQSGSFVVNVMDGELADITSASFVQKTDPNCDLRNNDCALEATADEDFRIKSDTFEQGVQPKSQLRSGQISQSDLRAGPGRHLIGLPLMNGNHEVPVRGATLAADLDLQDSDPSHGLVVNRGKLGGYIWLKDLLGAINDGLSSCACLGNPKNTIQLLNTDPTEPDLEPAGCYDGTLSKDQCTLSCNSEVTMEASECGSGSPSICQQVDTICSSVGLLTDTADLDADGDGHKDSLSFGAIVEMTRAKISGVVAD